MGLGAGREAATDQPAPPSATFSAKFRPGKPPQAGPPEVRVPRKAWSLPLWGHTGHSEQPCQTSITWAPILCCASVSPSGHSIPSPHPQPLGRLRQALRGAPGRMCLEEPGTAGERVCAGPTARQAWHMAGAGERADRKVRPTSSHSKGPTVPKHPPTHT